MHTRHCVACDQEFRPEIVYCSDCGGLLEDRWDGLGAHGTPLEPELAAWSEPEEHYTSVVTTAGSLEATRAVADLRKAGIRFRIDSHGSAAGFDVLVPAEDSERAVEVLQGHAAALSTFEGSDSAMVEGFCPACQKPVPTAAIECPECQLVVGNDHAFCESCNHVLEADDEKCRECGTARGRD